MSHAPNETVRLYRTADGLAEWPEYRCRTCGEWKPAMAYPRIGYLDLPTTQCKACEARAARKRKRN